MARIKIPTLDPATGKVREGQLPAGTGAGGGGLLTSNGPPPDSLGVDGQFCIDKANWVLYGPKTAGAWDAATELQGPPGPSQGSGWPQASDGMLFVSAANGNDTNSGLSWAEAKRTLQSAIDASVVGSLIYLGIGGYTESPTLLNKNGLRLVGPGLGSTNTANAARLVAPSADADILTLNGSDRVVLENFHLQGTAVRSTTLPSAITATSPATGGTLTLVNASALDADKGYVVIDNEVIRYDSKNGNDLVGITRGWGGATNVTSLGAPAAHANGATVSQGTYRGRMIVSKSSSNCLYSNIGVRNNAGGCDGGVYGGTGISFGRGEGNKLENIAFGGVGLCLQVGIESSLGFVDGATAASSYKTLLFDHAEADAPRSYLADELPASNTSTIPLENASAFAANGTGRIGNEWVTWTGKTGNTLTGVTRGALYRGEQTAASFQPKRRTIVQQGSSGQAATAMPGGWRFLSWKSAGNRLLCQGRMLGDGSREYSVDLKGIGTSGSGNHTILGCDWAEGGFSDIKISSDHNRILSLNGAGTTNVRLEGSWNQIIDFSSDNTDPDSFVLAPGSKGNRILGANVGVIRDDGTDEYSPNIIEVVQQRGGDNNPWPNNHVAVTRGPLTLRTAYVSRRSERPRAVGRYFGNPEAPRQGDLDQLTLLRQGTDPNNGYLAPIFVGGRVTFNEMRFEIVTPSSSANRLFRATIYAIEPDKMIVPGSVSGVAVLSDVGRIELASGVDLSTPGPKAVPISLTVDLDWIGVMFSNANASSETTPPIVRAWRSKPGANGLHGLTGADLSERGALCTRYAMGAGAPPDNPPVAAYSDTVPHIILRRAA